MIDYFSLILLLTTITYHTLFVCPVRLHLHAIRSPPRLLYKGSYRRQVLRSFARQGAASTNAVNCLCLHHGRAGTHARSEFADLPLHPLKLSKQHILIWHPTRDEVKAL